MSRPVLRNLFSFAGRRRRRSFAAVIVSLAAIFLLVFAVLPPVTDPPEAGDIVHAAWLAACWIAATLAASQRFRDFNWSGWWGLAALLPLVGWLILIALFFIPGTRGPNRFGPDPREIQPLPAH